jgi:hypothetical protein
MKLSESDLLDLLNSSPSFRESCAHTLAVLLADSSPVADCAPVCPMGLFDDLDEIE